MPYPSPAEYEDTSFWSGQILNTHAADDTRSLVHPNHTALRIVELNDSKPRICYNNFNRAPSDGSIINFLDGVPNANVTIYCARLYTNQQTLILSMICNRDCIM